MSFFFLIKNLELGLEVICKSKNWITKYFHSKKNWLIGFAKKKFVQNFDKFDLEKAIMNPLP